ncbi:MAG: nucleoid DNA-binding protein [Limisphaerales bacterium]|jgi:nucleoid DNA-binding protein
MNTPDKKRSTVTKRDLATRVRLSLKPNFKLQQAHVAEVITRTLDVIRDALVNGDTVELRNFGVFKIEIRKERIGRNPKNPSVDIQIPARKVVKFRSGKEMKEQLEAGVSTESETPPPPEPDASFGSE